MRTAHTGLAVAKTRDVRDRNSIPEHDFHDVSEGQHYPQCRFSGFVCGIWTLESCMAKKLKAIPAVPFDLISQGLNAVNEDRAKYGSAEPMVSLVRVFHKRHQPEEIMAVSYRLGALAKILQEGKGKSWTFAVNGEGYHMVNEALLKAAARAPLFEARTIGEVSFDFASFEKIALEESETDGTA
jgi:hypothetical protein